MSESRLFYEQAAAVCRYLYFGEGGAHRMKLFDFIARHYKGEGDRLGIEDVFGMSPAALGGEVEKYCREVLAAGG